MKECGKKVRVGGGKEWCVLEHVIPGVIWLLHP